MMQKIQMTNGVWRFKSKALYRGIKVIDKEKAAKNLHILKELLDKYNVEFQLAYGTLLGAVRDKDFISHDEDCDLIVLSEYKQKFIDLLPLLSENGFDVVRYDRRDLLSIMRDGEYIDIYFFRPYVEDLRISGCDLSPAFLLESTTEFEFKGYFFRVPEQYEEFLKFEYGENWRTPIQWANFEVPKWKRLLFTIKDKLKNCLPDSVYFYLANKAGKRILDNYWEKVKVYRDSKKS